MKKLHFIQHVPFEDMANIKKWAVDREFSIDGTRIFDNENFPQEIDFDLLVIMGGPMSVYEENKYSWLKEEKIFLDKVINAGKKVLGVCLGAQFIADVLGAKVYKGYKEIGWYDIEKVMDGNILRNIPDIFNAFHWHGDTFDIPSGGERLFKSKKTPNQGFLFNNKVMALQFHLEVTVDRVINLIKHSENDLKGEGLIQDKITMERLTEQYQRQANKIMYDLLDNFNSL